MKKLLSVLLISLASIQCISANTYANCDMSYIDEEQIDFTKTKIGAPSFTQTIDNKEVMITRYEQISKIEMYFEKKIFDRIKKLVQNYNSNIDANVFIHMLSKVIDLFTNSGFTEGNALNQIEKVIDGETLNNLNEEERKEAAVDGRDSAIIPTLGATAICTALGSLSKAGIEKIARSGAVKLILTKLGFTAVGESVGTAIATLAGGALIPILTFFGISKLYSKFYVEPFTEELNNLLSSFKYVYSVFKCDVINHRWMDGNVLITAIPTNSSCTEGYSHFHNIDGIRYNKSQKAINWEFAKAECRFLNADHDNCYQIAKEIIECLWDNLDDPSKCKSNPYYYGNAEKYEL